jgi:hypothetical protein
MRRTRRKALAATFPVLIVATLLSATMASTASSDPDLDLSSDAAIVDYLGSIGIDPADAVWQRGLRNYAGPSCPGPDWNCVPANAPIVQIAAPLGTNQFHCTGPDCVVVQVASDDDGDDDDGDDDDGDNGDGDNGDGDDGDDDGDDGNVATCEMHSSSSSSSSNVLQVCIIGQESADGSSNAASIKMSIKQSSGSRTSTQTARQVGRITQVNTTGKNVASIWESIGQSQSASGGSTISQSQEAHQSAVVDQDSTSGDNASDIDQWQNQSQYAERATASITQRQNTAVGTDFTFCDGANGTLDFDQAKNQCAEVTQDSSLVPGVGGNNHSDLEHRIREGQTATKSLVVDQDQGDPSNGQGGTVDQLSSAPADSEATQDTIQVQKASYAPTVSQFKDAGDPRCCQSQGTNEANRAEITQKTDQFASSPTATQRAIFVGDCLTTGTCSVLQSATINGETETNDSCTDSNSCFEVFVCTSAGEGSFCSEEEEGSG